MHRATNACLSKTWVPCPQPQNMGLALGRACPGLAFRLHPPPWDVLYQGGPIKGTKVLMGCRHPSSALAAGPGLGCHRNPNSQPCQLRPQGREGEAGSWVSLPWSRTPKLCEDRAQQWQVLPTWQGTGRRWETRHSIAWTLESSSLEFKTFSVSFYYVGIP